MTNINSGIVWLETWSSKQFTGVSSTVPPQEPQLDETETKSRLEHARHQVPDLRMLIREGRASEFRGKLVSVHMAVVETLDPEYYPGAVQDHAGRWRCAKYGNDRHNVQNGMKQVAYWERMPVSVQSTPGLSEWCESSGPVESVCSKLAQQNMSATGFPDPNEPDCNSGIVLLYNCAAKLVQIHDVIHVVGILDDLQHTDHDDCQDDYDAIMDSENVGDNENEGIFEAQAAMGRRSWRVHAMDVEVLRNLDSSPYERLFIKRSMAGEFFRQMRAAAIDWLAGPFGGDRLCGELLLLQLMCKNSAFAGGRVARRMTLNIHGPTQLDNIAAEVVSCSGKSWGGIADAAGPSGVGHSAGTTSRIASAAAEAAAAVYPYVNILPVTDAVTAQRSLFPYHDASANRLRTGMLQQAPHSCIVMDECMQPLSPSQGEHNARRARNLQSLQAFLANGVLEADYTWQQVQLPVSGSALLLSPQPSTFASACHVCVRAEGDGAVFCDSAQSPLQGMRSYLASAWDLWDRLSYESAEDGSPGPPQWIQRKLVSRGKAIGTVLNRLSSAATDTMRAYEATVVLLHCTAVSHGCNCVSEAEWQRLEELVDRVAARGCAATVTPPQANHAEVLQQSVPIVQDVNRNQDSQQREPGASAGEAMIAALRSKGQIQ
eukprot:jgi/Ulvmu1/10509/UM064_0047.1